MSSKRCSNCGHMIPSDSAYCVECGALQAVAPPIFSRVSSSKRPPVKIRSVYIVIMLVSLAIGASIGYFFGAATSPPMPRTVTETATTTRVITSATTTTAIPTLGSEELSGVLLVNTLKAVYRLDMRNSAKPQWELFMNESVKSSRISPDGRYLAYNLPESGIYIMDMATGESRILLKHHESLSVSCISWSPDGSRISYQANENYVLDLSGRRQLVDRPRPSQLYTVRGKPGVTADVHGEFGCLTWAGASTLLYQRFLGPWPRSTNLTCFGDSCWGTIDADTTTVATLTADGVRLRNLPQRWLVEKASPNAVLLRDEEKRGFHLVQSSDLQTAGGKRPTLLAFCETSKCRETYFSPDGTQVAFLVESSGYDTSIVLVDVATTETHTPIPLGIRYISDFAWFPGGKEMILRQNDLISTLDLQTRIERRILAGSTSLLMWGTAWSRDAKYLAVLAVSKAGAPERAALCIVRLPDGAYYLLPPLPKGIQTPEILCWLAGSS